MVDRLYSEPRMVELYDAFFTWTRRPEYDFYMSRVMAAERVLDVGCGTGELLHMARERGHTGRLCGLDPAPAMLDRARRRSDIEWIDGTPTSVGLDGEFDLVVMTGHAFQALVGDDEIRATFGAIRGVLAGDGRFVFETRNPGAREWKSWTPDNPVDVVDDHGAALRIVRDVDRPVEGDLVSFTLAYAKDGWDEPEVSRTTLRFLDAETLASFLSDAGLVIEEQFGDWDRQPITDTSLEIITIARRAPSRDPVVEGAH